MTDLYQAHAAAAPRAGTHTLIWVISETDATPHINAKLDKGTWKITATASLVDAINVSEDLFTLLACHEAGHLVGGYPFKASVGLAIESQGTSMAAESQADYCGHEWLLPSKRTRGVSG